MKIINFLLIPPLPKALIFHEDYASADALRLRLKENSGKVFANVLFILAFGIFIFSRQIRKIIF